MPTIDVYNMEGKVCGTLELSDKVFAAQVNGPVIHSVVRAYLLNQRQGTQSTLTRSEVAGGGRKPWRQKGTGRARQGSTRAPQWTKGGIATIFLVLYSSSAILSRTIRSPEETLEESAPSMAILFSFLFTETL